MSSTDNGVHMMRQQQQVTYTVAPDGHDDTPGTEARPFATLERARDAIGPYLVRLQFVPADEIESAEGAP